MDAHRQLCWRLSRFAKPITGSDTARIQEIFGSANPTRKSAFYVEIRDNELKIPSKTHRSTISKGFDSDCSQSSFAISERVEND